MTTATVVLVLAAFLACAVEAVEALTVVLAVGVTRGWRSTLIAAGAATLALAALGSVLGPALARMPIDALRIIVGTLLLVFGLQWLRKAVLRASGYRALRDEAALYRAELRQAQGPRECDEILGRIDAGDLWHFLEPFRPGGEPSLQARGMKGVLTGGE